MTKGEKSGWKESVEKVAPVKREASRAESILRSEKGGRETVQTSKRKEKKKREGLAVAKLQNIELTTIISPTISVFQDR